MQPIKKQFNYLKINLVNPEKIKKWGTRFLPNGKEIGEINKPSFFKNSKLKTTFMGLYCETTFGPLKNWECQCGKYKLKSLKKKLICDICNVEVTDTRVRRYRFGFIKLNCPILHSWYLHSIPNYLSLILDIPKKVIHDLAYYRETDYDINQNYFEGTQAIERLLKKVNLNFEILQDRLELTLIKINKDSNIKKFKTKVSANNEKKLIQRIRLLENFLYTKSHPSWLILKMLPVLPAGIRPIIEINIGKFLISDLSQFYKQIIICNNTVSFLDKLPYTSRGLVNAEKALLQKSIDVLFLNNSTRYSSQYTQGLKPLGEIIQGKFGRFRQNLLGKRVDFSGRSVIVVNPNLKMDSCGLPYLIAINIFLPFILRHLLLDKKVKIIKNKLNFIDKNNFLIWKILKIILRKKVILLNRAPTLHRLGIQAFFPTLVTSKAIELHPLVCTAFNADFDGDQMAIHLPLSLKAQVESKKLMLPGHNILSAASGDPIVSAAQDMILGCYYLTLYNPTLTKNFKYFNDFYSIFSEYNEKKISLHSTIYINTKLLGTFEPNKYLKTTVGRILFYFSLFNTIFN
jgi:DNA-directed RNA polymerase subunit beta'